MNLTRKESVRKYVFFLEIE